jgi:hypothetical protein
MAVLGACGGGHGRDQSTAIVRAINERVAEMRHGGQAHLTFTHLPKSTLGKGTDPIKAYEVTFTGTHGNGSIEITEKGGQTRGTYQFPEVLRRSRARQTVAKAAGEPLTFVLTRVGDTIELTEMR